MASIEYTQVFKHTAGAGGDTGPQYFQLGITPPAAGSAFVVKYMSISSSSGLANTAPDWTAKCVTSDDGIGTNAHPFFLEDAGGTVADDGLFYIFDSIEGSVGGSDVAPFSQVIIKQPYIGVSANMTAAGTFTVVISYLVIPSTNALVTNFNYAAGTGVPGNVSILSSTTSTRIIKSIIVVNTDPSNTYTVRPALFSSGTPYAYIGTSSTIAVGFSQCWTPPIYLYASDTLTIGLVITSGGAGIPWYISYTQDPYA